MKNDKIKTIAYMALYVALYVVLKWVGNLIPFLQMPNGGSIELELIAVFIASYHLGWLKGLCVALLSWLITWVLGFPMWFVHPVQIFLDYAGPLMVCGMASFLWPFKSVGQLIGGLLSIVVGVGAYLGVANSYALASIPSIVLTIIAVAIGIAACGFTYWYVLNKKKFGIVIAMLLKYAFQVLSGVYFWFPDGAAAGSREAWVFSIGYNFWYNAVTMAVCLFVVPMLISRLEKTNIHFKA